MDKSIINKFYNLDTDQRIEVLYKMGLISSDEKIILENQSQVLSIDNADKMSENVIGVFGLPLSIASNFLVNGKEYIVPMVVEEPSIVAGVSSAAKIIKNSGGFTARLKESFLIGQIQFIGIKDIEKQISILSEHRSEILKRANNLLPNLVKRGGGVEEIEIHKINLGQETSIVLHLLVNTSDAMGANLVNSLCEELSVYLEKLVEAKTGLKILSNYTDRSLVKIDAEIKTNFLNKNGYSGEEVRDGIINACNFALSDPYRAATHNKGIMNGVDAVAIATGNDWRAIEAGAHAYASSNGHYKSLSKWSLNSNGNLVGQLLLPLKLGIVGGSLAANPGARLGLNITKVKSSSELSELIGAVGLAQNLAALRALVTGGIQQGHMKLHARSVAVSAGVPGQFFSEVVREMIDSGEIKSWKAKEILEKKIKQLSKSNQFKKDNKIFRGSASGKYILLGEHGVVYKQYAIACPIESAVDVIISKRSKKSLFVLSGYRNIRVSKGSEFFEYFKSMVKIICNSLNVDEFDAQFEIHSRIPLAMGLGASASFSVALCKAIINTLQLSKSIEEINQIAFECEKVNHITPSGIDNTVATYNSAILFKEGKSIETLSNDISGSLPIVIGLSKSSSKTADMVRTVNNLYKQNKSIYQNIFNQMGDISKKGFHALKKKNYDELGYLMNISQGLLNSIGVSNLDLESMIEISRSSGALGAKITGSGGGGSIIALCPEMELNISENLKNAGYETIVINKSTKFYEK